MKSKALIDANDTQAIIRRYMSDLGKKGGAKTKEKGHDHFVEIGKLGGRPRKDKIGILTNQAD